MRTPFTLKFPVLMLAAFLAIPLLSAPWPAAAFSLGGLFGSPVDAELAAQVPQDKRAAINAADFALACANEDLALAKLKEELADRQDDLAALGTKLAKAQARGAEIDLDIAKMEAIIASRLGKAEDNAKILAELKADRVKNEAERGEYAPKIYQGTLFVRDWTQRVAQKEKYVAEFKARRGGDAAKPAPAKAPAAPAPAEEPSLIINKTPGGGEQPQQAAPEADLKN